MSAVREDVHSLKQYLRHRIEQWLKAAPGREQQEFAKMAGISPAHLSGILKGRSFSDGTFAGILEAFGLGLEEGVHEAIQWAKSQPMVDPISNKSLLAALEAVERDDGVVIPPQVRANMNALLATGVALGTDVWMNTIRANYAAAKARGETHAADNADGVARTEKRPIAVRRRPTKS